MSHEVFLSSSLSDKVLAQRMHRILEKSGIATWIHEENGNVEDAINAIGQARVMVLIYSEHSNICPRVRRETERAVSRNLAIVPFRVADTPLSPSMEYFISSTHWFDALDGPPESHFDRLCDVVCRLLIALETAQNAKAEAALIIDPATLKRMELNLAAAIGPVAKVFVQQTAGAATNVADFTNRLSRLIEQPLDRAAFIDACRRDGFLPALPAVAVEPVLPRKRVWHVLKSQNAAVAVETPRLSVSRIPFNERPIDDALLETATRQLTLFVGPVARVLVKRSAHQASDAGDLALQLAEHLASPREKEQFLKALRST